MRSTWLDLACTRFRYITDFQKNNKCNSCFVTISNNIQVKYCRLDDRYNLVASTNALSSLLNMPKWHAHVVHMAKHMIMVWYPFLVGVPGPGLLSLPLNQAVYHTIFVER